MQISLTTTGRRTGMPRKVTLYAFPDADRLVVVASLGGAPRDPWWAANLRAEPRATVHLGRDARAVRAQEVAAPERDRLWRLVCEGFPMYATYQRKTTRIIPLFALEPVPDTPG
jgi:deazaflavin-dependent oxidoreductase (nitroreductase family)